jgi:hypothetical protein
VISTFSVLLLKLPCKDPREYLPFLRSLRALDPAYQRFTIDSHLKRHASALRHLRDAGTGRFEEAKEYMVKWHLYEDGLALWRGREGYDVSSYFAFQDSRRNNSTTRPFLLYTENISLKEGISGRRHWVRIRTSRSHLP